MSLLPLWTVPWGEVGKRALFVLRALILQEEVCPTCLIILRLAQIMTNGRRYFITQQTKHTDQGKGRATLCPRSLRGFQVYSRMRLATDDRVQIRPGFGNC
jgi:hypothetical protein